MLQSLLKNYKWDSMISKAAYHFCTHHDDLIQITVHLKHFMLLLSVSVLVRLTVLKHLTENIEIENNDNPLY